MERSYLVYIEGVNIASVTDDTGQLSVKRGGSQLLRTGPEKLIALFKQKPPKEFSNISINTITQGASKGLFFVETSVNSSENSSKPELLSNNIESALFRMLTESKQLQHFTFIISAIDTLQAQQIVEGNELNESNKKSPTFEEFNAWPVAKYEQLIYAKARFQQYRQSTLSIPAFEGASKPCAWDNLRPQLSEEKVRRSNYEISAAKVSLSVKVRHDEGRKKKSEIIHDVLNHRLDCHDLTVISDLKRLAEPFHRTLNNDNKKEPLEGIGFCADKMAVFYADGNSFGSKFAQCENAKELTELTKRLAAPREQFLLELVTLLSRNKYGHNKVRNNKQEQTELKMEILLWGGDEIMLAVPAWFGWQMAELFFSTLKETSRDEETYAAGLVFCQANTPISRVEKVAKDLAESVKLTSKQKNGLGYLVFESVDFPTNSVENFLQQQFSLPNEDNAHQCMFLSSDMLAQSDYLLSVTENILGKIDTTELATRQLYKVSNAIQNRAEDGLGEAKAVLSNLSELMSNTSFKSVEKDISTLFTPMVLKNNTNDNREKYNCFSDYIPWLHLLETKDYLNAYRTVNKQ